MSVLLSETKDGVCRLVLNRPQSRNALNDELIAALAAALQAADADEAARVIVLSAAGTVFCAGHDLREVRQKKGLPEYRRLFAGCAQMMLSISRLKKPVIAQVDGMATAAGCQLVASCDLAIASPRAKFATPGVHIGLFCSTPMVPLSRKVGRKTAMAMLLTGEPLAAEDAAAAGLINKVVAEDQLAAACDEWARVIADKSPLTLAIGKEAFYKQADMPLPEAYDYASEVMADNMTRQDAQEGVAAFVEKRKPVWTGA